MAPVLLVGPNGETGMAATYLHYKTKPRMIKITNPHLVDSVDLDLSLPYREELKGVEVRAIFDHESLGLFVDDGDVAVYLEDIVEVCLNDESKFPAAEAFGCLKADRCAFVIFPSGSYEYI